MERRENVQALKEDRREAHPFNVLTAPVIYSGFVPLLVLDLFVTLYQAACFPVYGIPRARRGDYMVFDRGDLPYLNVMEKINCFYPKQGVATNAFSGAPC